MKKQVYFIGDSQFTLRSNKSNSKSLNLVETIYTLVDPNKLTLYNYSHPGDTLLGATQRFIISGPMPFIHANFLVIGYGTNDSNYYYSLNSHLITPDLHKELLINLITKVINSNLLEKVYLLPVPPVKLLSDPTRNSLINEQINYFNSIRESIAKKFDNVLYVSSLNYDNKLHIAQDGLHFNGQGLAYAAQTIAQHLNKL